MLIYRHPAPLPSQAGEGEKVEKGGGGVRVPKRCFSLSFLPKSMKIVGFFDFDLEKVVSGSEIFSPAVAGQ